MCLCSIQPRGENYMAPAFMYYNKSKPSVVAHKKSVTMGNQLSAKLDRITKALSSQLYRLQNNTVQIYATHYSGKLSIKNTLGIIYS